LCIPFCDQSVQTTRISLSLRGFAYRLAADHRSQDLSRRISNRDSHSEGTHEKSETHFLIEWSHLFENNQRANTLKLEKAAISTCREESCMRHGFRPKQSGLRSKKLPSQCRNKSRSCETVLPRIQSFPRNEGSESLQLDVQSGVS